jgi:hypothetical protein
MKRYFLSRIDRVFQSFSENRIAEPSQITCTRAEANRKETFSIAAGFVTVIILVTRKRIIFTALDEASDQV